MARTGGLRRPTAVTRPGAGLVRSAVAGVIVAVLLAAVGACSPTSTSTSGSPDVAAAASGAVPGAPPPPEAFGATVLRVVDGDTFHAAVDGREVTVRLIGVDTPETKRPGTPVQCFGPEASAALETLLPTGAPLRAAYEADHPQDRYGRDLWDVWLADGTFVNGSLVSQGAAVARSYPPTTAHAAWLDAQQDAARAAGLGLWSACPGDQIPRHD